MNSKFLNFVLLVLFLFFPFVALSSEVEVGRQQVFNEHEKNVIRFKEIEKGYLKLEKELEEKQVLIAEKLTERHDDNSIAYAEWAAIILTCVAILVTVLGVLIAILSVWGYKNIIKEAKNSAERISNEASSDIAKEKVERCINDIAKEELVKLIHAGELREHFENAIDMVYRRHGLSGEADSFGFAKYPEIDEEETRK